MRQSLWFKDKTSGHVWGATSGWVEKTDAALPRGWPRLLIRGVDFMMSMGLIPLEDVSAVWSGGAMEATFLHFEFNAIHIVVISAVWEPCGKIDEICRV